MVTLDRPTCARNRLSAFQVVQGFSAPAGRCSSALMKVHTGVQGLESFSPWLPASSFRCCVNGFSAFDEAPPRFQARHQAEMSIGWVPLVRSLSCPFRTTCHRSPVVRVRLVRVDFWCLLGSDSLRSFDKFHSVSHPVSLHGWSAPTPSRRTRQLTSIALERTT